MKNLLTIAALLLLGASASAQVVSVPFTSDRWEFSGSESEVVLFKGQEALRMQGGAAWLQDADFSDGMFEFDVAFSDTRGFQGVRWNVQDRSNYEEFYLRSHLSGMPDANQYTPVIAGVSAWQLLHGSGYSVPSLYTDDWMHVQIVVEDGVGEVYIDADTSAFAFRMKGGWESGGFGFYASQLNVAYYTNFAYRTEGGGLQKEPVKYAENEAGTVLTWRVSDPFAEEMTPTGSELTGRGLDRHNWQSVWAEEAGITNLARAAVGKEGRTTLARVTINSSGPRGSSVQFGYSDRVSVYLNGMLLYKGDNTYVSRDYRYLGTIGQFDEVPLSLQSGVNELVFVVSEGFGGWGITATFPDTKGLSFEEGAMR